MIDHIRLVLDGSKATIGLIILGVVILGPPVLVMHDLAKKLPAGSPESTFDIVFSVMFDLMPWVLIIAMAFMLLSVMRR